MAPYVAYIHYATYSREQDGDIITFAYFEEGFLLSEICNLLSETSEDMESHNKYDYNSTLPLLISEEKMDLISSVDDSDAEHMSTEMLEGICDGSQSHPSINRREARYKILGCIKQGRSEWKGALLSTQNMGKILQKLCKAVVNYISQALPILV